jgi:hypothetical protein
VLLVLQIQIEARNAWGNTTANVLLSLSAAGVAPSGLGYLTPNAVYPCGQIGNLNLPTVLGSQVRFVGLRFLCGCLRLLLVTFVFCVLRSQALCSWFSPHSCAALLN